MHEICFPTDCKNQNVSFSNSTNRENSLFLLYKDNEKTLCFFKSLKLHLPPGVASLPEMTALLGEPINRFAKILLILQGIEKKFNKVIELYAR